MRQVRIIGYGKDKGHRSVKYGKQTRHYMDDQQSHYTMTKCAIDLALEKADMTMEGIDLIVFAGAIGYQPIPCSAALISAMYNVKKPIPCMDINTTCTSFITALDTVAYFTDSKRYNKVLIVSADTASLGINPKQKESYELFSDGAAAIIVEHSESDQSGVDYALQMTWSEGAHDTEIRGGLSSLHPRHHDPSTEEEYLFDMNGPKVLRLVAKTVPIFINRLEKESGYLLSDMDLIIPHQASRALPVVMKRLGVKPNQYMNYVEAYGNMIASSIPFMLTLALEEEQIKTGDRVLLFGTAAGLTISGLILTV